jgi:hypothetical protein
LIYLAAMTLWNDLDLPSTPDRSGGMNEDLSPIRGRHKEVS